MTKLPVALVHFGDAPPYAQTVIAHAQHFGNEVVFLNPSLDELHAHPFAKVYEHLSTNHFDFELSCIVRWFWLRDWMQENVCQAALYLDTDVLLYANAEDEWREYRRDDFTLSLGTSGHTSFWKRLSVELFCYWVSAVYSDRSGTFKELQRIYAEMQAQNLAGGISDMALLKMFTREFNMRVGEMSVVRDGSYWDHNFSSDDGFSMEQGHKRIFMYGGLPYGLHKEHDAPILFKSVHFQGDKKSLIPQYAYDPARMPQ